MTNQNRYHQETGSIRQPLWRLIVAALVFYGTLAYLLGSFPVKLSEFQLIGRVLATLGGISLFWMNYRPSLYAKSFLYICIGIMLMLITIRSITYIVPSNAVAWTVLIILSFVSAYLSPLLTQEKIIANNDRSINSDGKILRKLLRLISLAGPFAGLAGAIFGIITSDNNITLVQATFFGIIAWILGLLFPLSTNRPIYPIE